MKHTLHTQGPWKIGTKNGARIWSENGETLIADADASDSLRKETKKANAILISAAPDLLEALQYAIKQVPELATVPGVSAAIAKATGEQA